MKFLILWGEWGRSTWLAAGRPPHAIQGPGDLTSHVGRVQVLFDSALPHLILQGSFRLFIPTTHRR
jgi:hypothetical protein